MSKESPVLESSGRKTDTLVDWPASAGSVSASSGDRRRHAPNL